MKLFRLLAARWRLPAGLACVALLLVGVQLCLERIVAPSHVATPGPVTAGAETLPAPPFGPGTAANPTGNGPLVRGPAATPYPTGNGAPVQGPGAMPDPTAGVAPMELNWILCRMLERPALAPDAAQRARLRAVLEAAKRLVTATDAPWKEYEGWVRCALSAEQRAHMTAALAARPAGGEPFGGPMHTRLFAMLEARSGVRFQQVPLAELDRQARTLPLRDPNAPPGTLNPEDFAYALLTLEDNAALRLTRAQAIQVLPYVRLQTDRYLAHQHEKEALLTILSPPQRRFVVEARALYPHGVPPLTGVDELLAALGAAAPTGRR